MRGLGPPAPQRKTYAPRMTSRPFNVRMDDDLKSRISERVDAGEAGNQSEWAREALAGVDALGGLPALARAIELVGGDSSHAPHPARALQLQKQPTIRKRHLEQCPHPESQQVQTPYSVRCTLCGATIQSVGDVAEPPPADEARELGHSSTMAEEDILRFAGTAE